MPQLVFKGVKEADVAKLSTQLSGDLSKISTTPEDYFTFEFAPRVYYFKGTQIEMYPLVEVIQFERAQEVEAKMARRIQEAIYQLGYQECEVYFVHVDQKNYYL